MRHSSLRSVIQRDLRHFGVWRTAVDVAFRAINLCVYFRVLRALGICELGTEKNRDAANIEWQFLTAEQLHEFAAEPANLLPIDFLEEALAKGDRCLAALAEGELVAYSWYSHEPTEADGLLLCFRPDYVYMYKAFTRPSHRGQRLYESGVRRALAEFLALGYRGLICDVEIYNFASLKALNRLGFRQFGYATLLKAGRYSWRHASRGCREYGYRHVPLPARRNARSQAATQPEQELMAASN